MGYYKSDMEISYDLNTLRTFILVAQDLNFTSVAERRNTVQSAVSNQIKKLEDSLGQTLVSRGRGQTMSLTSEGRIFLAYARRIIALSEEATENILTAHSRDVLRLGTTITLALSLVVDVLRVFCALRPDVQIQIQCDRSDQLLRKLEDGEIDVAFMMDQGRHPLRKFVHTMDLEWVCSADFEMRSTDTVPLAFMTDGKDLRRYALDALDRAGLRGHILHLSPHPIGVRTLVQAGLAFTVMPSATIAAPLTPVPKKWNMPALSPIALAGYQGLREENNGAQILINQLEASCK